LYVSVNFLTKISLDRNDQMGAPFRGRRAGSAGELPFAWIEEEAKPAFNVHGSGRELTRQSLVSLDDIK
jgi:hypothetical protein